MKKLLIGLLMAVSFNSFATTFAEKSPFWTCEMTFKAKARGLQVIIGDFTINGDGKLRCSNLVGDLETIPIKITIGGSKLAMRIGFGKYAIYGASTNITLFNSEPEDILGNYKMATLSGSLGAGAGTFVGTHVELPSFSLNLSMQVTKGIGFNVGLDNMSIEYDENYQE